MGANPEVLKSTINEYNSACDRGRDEVFSKEVKYLLPLRTPPYYAMRCHPIFLTTIGGIKINYRMEVLNREDDPIRGLYAGGNDTGVGNRKTVITPSSADMLLVLQLTQVECRRKCSSIRFPEIIVNKSQP